MTELGISALIGGMVQISATHCLKMQEIKRRVGPMGREEDGRKVEQGESPKAQDGARECGKDPVER